MKTLKLIFPVICGAAMLIFFPGCSTAKGPKFDARASFRPAGTLAGVSVTNELDPAWLQRSTDFFTIGPGDAIEVEILGSPNTHAILTVGPDGKIYFQMLPGTDVWGLTLSETKDLLAKGLSQYITGAQVSVTLRNVGSKSIWMLGRVTKPGVYPMAGPMTLLEAIALAGGTARNGEAGGVEDQADLRHSFVQRRGQFLSVDFNKLLNEGDMSQNIYLQPDDFVYLPSSLFHEVFVLGAVRSPRTVPYGDRLTLVSAISASLGPMPGAYLSHVAIVRGSLAEPKVAVVNFHDIVAGKEPDIRLEPHDIIYVPSEPFSGLKAYARSILATFVNTIAANEGVNAVILNGNAVGIAVGPGGNSGP